MKKAHEKEIIPLDVDIRESIRQIKEGFIPIPVDTTQLSHEQFHFINHTCAVLIGLRDKYDKFLAEGITNKEETLSEIAMLEPLLPEYLEACTEKGIIIYELLLQAIIKRVPLVKEKINIKISTDEN